MNKEYVIHLLQYGVIMLITIGVVLWDHNNPPSKEERVDALLTPPSCATCPYYAKFGFACGHPRNHWPKWKSRPQGAVRFKSLSKRFFPVPPAWCKRLY